MEKPVLNEPYAGTQAFRPGSCLRQDTSVYLRASRPPPRRFLTLLGVARHPATTCMALLPLFPAQHAGKKSSPRADADSWGESRRRMPVADLIVLWRKACFIQLREIKEYSEAET